MDMNGRLLFQVETKALGVCYATESQEKTLIIQMGEP